MVDKIVAIENKLKSSGYQFFNKNDENAKCIYYHNPGDDIIDLSFDYLSDSWNMYYTSKAKIRAKKSGGIVSSAEIKDAGTFNTEQLYDLFVKENKDILEILS